MLVLSRKTNESIDIGDGVTVTIVRVKGKEVRVGIEAPKELPIIRTELRQLPPGDEPKKPVAA